MRMRWIRYGFVMDKSTLKHRVLTASSILYSGMFEMKMILPLNLKVSGKSDSPNGCSTNHETQRSSYESSADFSKLIALLSLRTESQSAKMIVLVRCS